MASIRCAKCGEETAYSARPPKFCAYCGGIFAEEAENRHLKAALAEPDYAKKRELLLSARAECPDSYEIEMELLCLGRLYEKGRSADFYRIPFWPLQALETPRAFPEGERRKMLSSFFENPAIPPVLELAPSPDAFWRDYLKRMAREYVNIFIRSSSANSLILGFHRSERDVMRRSVPCALTMAENIRTSALVPEPLRKILEASVINAVFSEFPGEETALYVEKLSNGRIKSPE